MAASKPIASPFTLSADTERAMRQCVHCGLCLASCPTYRELGTEMDSPRGRIYLIRGMHENRLAPSDDFGPDVNAVHHLDLCLGCRACETACPSGVHYGDILEGTRAAIHANRLERRGPLARTVQNTLMHCILPSRTYLRLLAGLLRFYDGLGLRRLMESRPMQRLTPRFPRQVIPKTPVVQGRGFHLGSEEVYPAKGEKRGRVCFFTGCVMDAIMGDIHRDTVTVLTEQGIEVVVPADQTCCGALHVHEGDEQFAIELAKRNVAVLRRQAFDAFVNNSAGCGAHIRSWGRLLSADAEYAEAAAAISLKSIDVTRYLVDLGIRPFPAPVRGRLAYDAPCHLLHAQKEAEAPMELMRAIPELQVDELPDADYCCGAAGSYTLTQPEMSARIFAHKLNALERVRPDIVATGNPGCIIQFESGIRQAGLAIEVLHPMQIAARAYRGAAM